MERVKMMRDLETAIRDTCCTANERYNADLAGDAVNHIVSAGLTVLDRYIQPPATSYFAIHNPSMEPLDIPEQNFTWLRDLVAVIKAEGILPKYVNIYAITDGIVSQVDPREYLVRPEPVWMDT